MPGVTFVTSQPYVDTECSAALKEASGRRGYLAIAFKEDQVSCHSQRILIDGDHLFGLQANGIHTSVGGVLPSIYAAGCKHATPPAVAAAAL